MYHDMDGQEIKVGEYISWKAGTEMSGKVVNLIQGRVIVDYNDPITGEPMKAGSVDPKRCWHE